MRASPNFDVTFNLNGGGSVPFLGLAIFQNADPVQGDSPKQLKLFGDAFSASRAKWDNVQMGTLVTPTVVDATQVVFNAAAEVTFNAHPGSVYRLQATPDLVAQPFTNVDEDVRLSVSGAGAVGFFDPDDGSSEKNYRVVSE